MVSDGDMVAALMSITIVDPVNENISNLASSEFATVPA